MRKRIKDNIINALEIIIKGLIERKDKELDLKDPKTCKELQESSIVLILKLYCILYSEAKGIMAINQQEPIQQLETLKGMGFSIPQASNEWSIDVGYLTDALVLLLSVEEGKNEIKIDYSTLPIQFLGDVHETLLDLELLVDEKGIHIIKGKGRRRLTGSYYTPQSIVNKMVSDSITPLLDNGRNGASEKKGSLVETILDLRVLDPAMGTGYFLLGALEFLTERLLDDGHHDLEWARREVASRCLHGVDLDPLTVELARFCIQLKTYSKGKQAMVLDENLKTGNSIMDEGLIEKGAYDVVIGNPPWGVKIPKLDRKFLENRFPQVNDYESFQYFSVMAIESLKTDGRHSFIVPNTLALNILAWKFRKWILENGSITCIHDYSEVPLFKDPGVRTLVYLFKKGPDKLPCKLIINEKRESKVQHEELSSSRTWVRFLRAEPEVLDILGKVEALSICLDEITESKQGYIPYRLTTLTRRFGTEEAKKIKETRAWHSNKKLNDEYKKELQGADVTRYNTKWSGVWVRYGRHVSTYIEMKFFNEPRLLFREITRSLPYSLVVACSQDEYVNNPSVITAIKRNENNKYPNYSLLSALAILNSSLISLYFVNTAPKARKGLFPKILVGDVRGIPVCRFQFDMPEEKRSELFEKVMTVHEGMVSQNDDLMLMDIIDSLILKGQCDVIHDFLGHLSKQCISSPEEVNLTQKLIDQVVFKLYGLSDEEIKITNNSLNL